MAKRASTSNTEEQDDNEIDLSDDDDDDDDDDDESIKNRPVKRMKTTDCLDDSLDVRVPHLLVLGTGCASPSPLRGSSGYAIFLPTIINGAFVLAPSVVLECGEGFLAMLHRHAPIKQSMQQHLSQIRLIWISHAHLDHFGGLPHLIHEIVKVNKQTAMCTCYQKGTNRGPCFPSRSTDADDGLNRQLCKRCSRICPPIVIAPQKVLRYLDCALNCKNGIINGQKMYVGITQRDFDTSPFSQQVRNDVSSIELVTTHNPTSPLLVTGGTTRTYCPVQFLKNIPVEHCPNAYACLIGLNTMSFDDQPSQNLFTFCYSGDTRPSSNIVRGCRDFSKACGRNVSLLLHEATFDADEKGKGEAIRKRHSTVEEAMMIARQIDLDSVLMTHFSQRYPKFPPGYDAEAARSEFRRGASNAGLEVASAYDGMLIPLKDGLRTMLPLIGSLAASVLT
jgi:ribonuclease Z